MQQLCDASHDPSSVPTVQGSLTDLLVQLVVLVAGTHSWQVLFGLSSPLL